MPQLTYFSQRLSSNKKRCPRCHMAYNRHDDFCRVCYQLNDSEAEALKESLKNQKQQTSLRFRLFIFISLSIGLSLIFIA